MSAHDTIEIRRLSPERLSAFLAFMEGDAFADNPKWRSCYCQFPLVDHTKVDWARRSVDSSMSACRRWVNGEVLAKRGPATAASTPRSTITTTSSTSVNPWAARRR